MNAEERKAILALATKTPWSTLLTASSQWGFVGVSPHGPIGWLKPGMNSAEENAANAALIVLAVNSYEADQALIAEMREALGRVSHSEEVWTWESRDLGLRQ